MLLGPFAKAGCWAGGVLGFPVRRRGGLGRGLGHGPARPGLARGGVLLQQLAGGQEATVAAGWGEFAAGQKITTIEGAGGVDNLKPCGLGA